MWLRLGGALLVTLVVIGLLEVLGAGSSLADRAPAEVQEAAHGRPSGLFWFFLFALVVATSLLAAARRGADQLKRALSRRS